MNKDELLRELSNKVNSGEITKSEIENIFGPNPVVSVVGDFKAKVSAHFSVTKLLYTLGAIIAVIGIVLFAYQVWPDTSSFGRVAITLGLGVVISSIGLFLSKKETENNKESLASVFYFMGGLLIPGGSMVALNEFNIGFDSAAPIAFTFGIIFAFYLLLNSVGKNAILTFFTIANGTAFVYSTVAALTDGRVNNYVNLYTYLTLIIGACYISLAYAFREGWNKGMSKFLYFFGFLGIQIAIFIQYESVNSYWSRGSLWPVVFSLGSVFIFYLLFNSYIKNILLTVLSIINGTAFMYAFVGALLKGSNPSVVGDTYAYLTMIIGIAYLLLAFSFKDRMSNFKLVEGLNFFGMLGLLGAAFSQIFGSPAWIMFFFLLVMGGFVFSIYLKSKSILVISTLFLLAYISYVTGKYFSDSLGWPLSLVMLGFVFIALGYISININKKYIKNN